MKLNRFLGSFLLITVLFACNTANKMQNASFGGRFETSKTNPIVASDSSAIEHKTNIASTSNSDLTKDAISTLPKKSEFHLFQTEDAPKTKKTPAKITKKSEPVPLPAVDKTLPMEPNSFWGFWLVIGSFGISILSSILSAAIGTTATTGVTTGLFVLASALSYAGAIAFIAGLVFGIIGLGIHKKNPGKYRGKGKAIAAVLIPSISIVLGLLLLIIVLALLFALI